MEQNNQIKHKNKGLIFIAVVLLTITIISSSIGLWAWAKYTSAHNSNATAQVAKWYFNLKTGDASIDNQTRTLLQLTRTDDRSHVEEGKLAPGTYGLLPIIIDTTGTETDLKYEVTITINNCPQNMVFTTKQGTQATQTVTGEGTVQSPRVRTITLSRYITHNETGEHDETVSWNWAYETGSGNDISLNDNADVNDSGKEVTVTISARGTEMLSKPLSFGTLKNGQTPISNGSAISLGVGDTTTLSVDGAESVTYSSSDSSKVTVSSTGVVTAIAAGSAVITIAGVDSGETMTVNVTVTAVVEPLEIGDSVAYTTTLNGQTLDDWSVFYVDGDYTYIILDDYLPNACISSLIQTEYGLSTYGTYIVYSDNNNRENIINAMATTSNWSDLINNGSINGTALSTEVKNNANVWAKGAPTVDLWVDSWNASYSGDTLYTRYVDTDHIDNNNFYATGYAIGDSENPTTYEIDLSSSAGYDDTLYFPYSEYYEVPDNDYLAGYWLASPSSANGLMYVQDFGTPNVGSNMSTWSSLAFRPVIKLPTSVVNQ